MRDASYDVIGIGSAIVDILSRKNDRFIADAGMVKGTMALVTAEESQALYKRIKPTQEMSGGSAANTMAGIASMGGTPAFIGRVGNDKLGKAFSDDIESVGVDFYSGNLPPSQLPTATCLVLVTPDGQRTMNTYLGACTELNPSDIDVDKVASSQVVYIEGYQWDAELAKQAIRKACGAAKDSKRQVALSLSDPFVVDRHRGDLLMLIEEDVDLLFGNQEEIFHLCEANDLKVAISRLREANVLACMTRGAKGAVVFDGESTATIPAMAVGQVVDTTGAGDLFAAGFLYGYTHGRDLLGCAKLGAMAAAQIISQLGARSKVPLCDLIEAQEL